jgi:hypothetical protein
MKDPMEEQKTEIFISLSVSSLPPVQLSEATAVQPIPIPTFPLKGKESLDRRQRDVVFETDSIS